MSRLLYDTIEHLASSVSICGSTGLPEEGPRSAAWHSLVFNKIRSLWTAHSSVPQGLNQLTGTENKCGLYSDQS